ncbi:hypothetical protein [Dubosiella newyorkensis]|uniref:hypothetical protein n=1 Tax=Dubosiella newyorkensis TaxID=1862672 RepID=UPI002572DB30|nr:hypothetical protein [Dubosiella newyorkensis]
MILIQTVDEFLIRLIKIKQIRNAIPFQKAFSNTLGKILQNDHNAFVIHSLESSL